jgi:hypothetical protein
MDKHNLLMINIIKELTTDNIKALKYICDDFVGSGKAENKSINQYFDLLENINYIKETDYSKLASLLNVIGRTDLAARLNTSYSHVSVPKNVKWELYLSKKIGPGWKQFAHLAKINYNNYYSRCDCILDVFKKMKNRGEFNWAIVKEILECMEHYYLIRKIENKFSPQ